MIVDNIFPIQIFSFQYDKLDELQEYVFHIENSITHGANGVAVGMTPSNLHHRPEFENLVLFFNDCLEQYKNYYQYDCDKISITAMWANMTIARSGNSHHQHKHPLSFVSGIFYLTEGSPTAFFNPSNFEMFHVWNNLPEGEDNYFYERTPKVGQLVLFPSWLQHSTRPHLLDLHRHTISINAIPAGMVNGNSLDQATRWNIEVK